MDDLILTLLIFLPIAGAIACLALPAAREKSAVFIGTCFAGVNLALSLALFAMFDRGSDELQFVTQKTWIDADYAGAQAKVKKAMSYVHECFGRSMQVVKGLIGA